VGKKKWDGCKFGGLIDQFGGRGRGGGLYRNEMTNISFFNQLQYRYVHGFRFSAKCYIYIPLNRTCILIHDFFYFYFYFLSLLME